jgi:hypothetical protein
VLVSALTEPAQSLRAALYFAVLVQMQLAASAQSSCRNSFVSVEAPRLLRLAFATKAVSPMVP